MLPPPPPPRTAAMLWRDARREWVAQHYRPALAALDTLQERFGETPWADSARRLQPRVARAVARDDSIRQAVYARAAAESAMPPAERAAAPTIRITAFAVQGPNSAGGVTLVVRWRNVGQRAIKYARFVVTAYNRVGDPAPCEVRGGATVVAEAVGPVTPGARATGDQTIWPNAWYNARIATARMERVELEFLDGGPGVRIDDPESLRAAQ